MESILRRTHVFRLVHLRLTSAVLVLVYINLQQKADISFLHVNTRVLLFQVAM